MRDTIAPALLAAVAVAQIALARTADLTPWKGGGFGMFSTLDHGAFRGVDVIIDGPDRSETLDIPPSLEERAARAVAYPSTGMLETLARAVADREHRQGRAVTTVRVSVWGTSVDPVTLHASQHRIRSLTWNVD